MSSEGEVGECSTPAHKTLGSGGAAHQGDERSCSVASRKLPVNCVVTVDTPGFCTPRIDMPQMLGFEHHRHPARLRISSIAVATCEVRCSWVCSRRA